MLCKKFRRGELTGSEVRAVVRALGNLPLQIHPSLSLLEGAVEIAIATARTVHDSLYVALAVALDCSFVTADARLLSALGRSGLSPHARHVTDTITA